MKSQRWFLGVALDASTVDTIRRCQAAQPDEGRLRWIPERNWHITLYFFGDVHVDMGDNLRALLSLGLRDVPPFTLEFDRYCLAPKPSEPRMIWARYQKQGPFRGLVQQLHQLYVQIDPTQQIRKSPIPHVTLARLRDWTPDISLNLEQPAPPPLTVDTAILWHSQRTPQGVVYEEVQRWPLRT